MASAAMPTLYSMPSLKTAGALKSGMDIMNIMGEMDDPAIIAGIKVLRDLGIANIGAMDYCFGANVSSSTWCTFLY